MRIDTIIDNSTVMLWINVNIIIEENTAGDTLHA